ncbi:MAG: hydrogenase formation protein HypD [Acidobacteria bacterium]|nr:MAG: hydrogenase formation protein HypD [Acidobacteriota bacterium]
MKYVAEYRDAGLARAVARRIAARCTRPWTVMEICGGQTHTILRYGLDQLLPPSLSLVHGPGCPVCVTPVDTLDAAMALARRPGVILTTFGDMLRVPGSRGNLYGARAEGGDVRVVASPLEAVALARRRPDRNVVFLAVGFETTAPATALAVLRARELGLDNFFLLVGHVLVPPAIRLLLSSPANRVQGFIAPGHVCTVAGYRDYERLAEDFGVPFVVGGFEPLDLMQALAMLVELLEEGRAEVRNEYRRSARRDGNRRAKELVAEVFEVCDRRWRGIGAIPRSGLRLRPRWEKFDAARRFEVDPGDAAEEAECRSAEVLQGLRRPTECPAFGTRCTPEHPLGAPMVSGEGACAAYYRYRAGGA